MPLLPLIDIAIDCSPSSMSAAIKLVVIMGRAPGWAKRFALVKALRVAQVQVSVTVCARTELATSYSRT